MSPGPKKDHLVETLPPSPSNGSTKIRFRIPNEASIKARDDRGTVVLPHVSFPIRVSTITHTPGTVSPLLEPDQGSLTTCISAPA